MQIAEVSRSIGRYLGAHTVPERDAHEKSRALQRTGLCGVVSAIWWLELLVAPKPDVVGVAFPLFLAGVSIASLAYWFFLGRHPGKGVPAQYAFLFLDPSIGVGILVYDHATFAFLNPLLVVVVVRCGIRYGLRTFWVEWSLTMLSAIAFLPFSVYWRTEVETTSSFFLMLFLIPVLFVSLLRRIHAVRALEEERARVAAVKEIVNARSGFLAKVSHEIRSPLQSIISALDLHDLRRANLPTDQDELISRIRRSCTQLNTQVRDLLTLARGDAGKLEINPEPFDAVELMRTLEQVLRDSAHEKGLHLVLDVPGPTMFVVADATRIDQILTNLATNSIRCTDKGQVQLSLAPLDAQGRLRFTIADTGPGIAADRLPTLLTPDRTSTGAERRGEGSGIGLAIVRTLVDHLGGTIEVTSKVGKGTSFEVTIPAQETLEERHQDPARLSTSRVLVVDDREDVVDALASVIDELGFDCDRAHSAAQGAALLAARKYDVALIDLEMPLTSGASLAGEVRHGDGPNRRTLLVAMSASAVRSDVGQLFDATLTKPIDRAALRRALLRAASAPRSPQPDLWVGRSAG